LLPDNQPATVPALSKVAMAPELVDGTVTLNKELVVGVLVPILMLPLVNILIASVPLAFKANGCASFVPSVASAPNELPPLQKDTTPDNTELHNSPDNDVVEVIPFIIDDNNEVEVAKDRELVVVEPASSTSTTSPVVLTERTLAAAFVVVAEVESKFVNLSPELPAEP
jgi:hypothetical protein